MTTSEGEALAREFKMSYFETSAKQSINVEEAYLSITTEIKDRILSDDDYASESNARNRKGNVKVTANTSNGDKLPCCS